VSGAGGTLTIRRMEPGDLDPVAGIEADLYPNPWRREHFREFLALPAGLAWVAADAAGEVVGYALAWVAADESEVANLAVARARQREGLGTRLLATALGEARTRGARRAWLEVRASNAAAQALYARHGFQVVGRRRGYYRAPREDALVMSAELEGSSEAP
jgi:[ribosomal protein S18]-alanine N-acetyltransferase